MNDSQEVLFKHDITPFSFLQRARKQLKLFDEGNPEAIFYAALELRMGIEARVFECIESSFWTTKRPSKQIRRYRATELLAQLLKIDPDADKPTTLVVAREGKGRGIAFQYTPVTRRLASYHGKIGEILHFTLFRNNKYWHYKETLECYREKSLLDFRVFLEKAAMELEEASRGALLARPKFHRIR